MRALWILRSEDDPRVSWRGWVLDPCLPGMRLGATSQDQNWVPLYGLSDQAGEAAWRLVGKRCTVFAIAVSPVSYEGQA